MSSVSSLDLKVVRSCSIFSSRAPHILLPMNRLSSLSTSMYVCMYICIYVYEMYVCMYVCMYTLISGGPIWYWYVCMYVCMYE